MQRKRYNEAEKIRKKQLSLDKFPNKFTEDEEAKEILSEPKTRNKALQGKVAKNWIDAMDEEILAVKLNNTRSLPELSREKTAIGNTPEKNALAEEKARKVKSNTKIKTKEVEKRVRKNKVTGKNKRNYKVASKSANGKENVKRKLLQEDNHGSDSEEETMEWYCLICCDLYSNSRPGEQWIECVMCKNWAHSKCLKSEDVHSYVCQNCNSDDDSE
ncbi:hypothetical protein JTB14_032129 [Gonioctena quinquepunctata]|nr:hypothetical protein JTB14_032129 [Gonioctena quinquepunctata]